MPWNGFGVFTRLYNWQNDALNNIRIRADRMDGEFDNYQDGLENCITRDGQNAPLAPLPMGGFTHINVGTAGNRDEYLQVGQYQDSQFGKWAPTTGSATLYTLTINPAPTGYTTGLELNFKAHVTCGIAPTINVNGLGPQLMILDGSALAPGDIVVNRIYKIIYNGTDFEVFTSSSGGGGGGGGTVTSIDITPPVSGITAAGGPITTAGAITLALSDDLDALENIGSTGLAVRTAPDTWTTRTITATAPLSVTNGDGIAGDPNISITGSIAAPFFTGSIATGRRYYPAYFDSLLSSGFVYAASTLYAHKIMYPARTWAGIGFRNISSVAGQNLRLGIYSDLNGYPDTLVFDSGNITLAGGGYKNVLSPIALSDQTYWMVWVSSTNSLQTQFAFHAGTAAGDGLIGYHGLDMASDVRYYGLSVAFPFGALPGAFPGGASLISAASAISYRVNIGYLIS